MIIRKLIVSPLYFLTQNNQLIFIEENGVGSKVLTNIQGQY